MQLLFRKLVLFSILSSWVFSVNPGISFAASTVTWVEPALRSGGIGSLSSNPIFLPPAGSKVNIRFSATEIPSGASVVLIYKVIDGVNTTGEIFRSPVMGALSSNTYSATWNTTGLTNGRGVYLELIILQSGEGVAQHAAAAPFLWFRIGALTSLPAPISLTTYVNSDEALRGLHQVDVTWLPVNNQHIGFSIERSDSGGAFREVARVVDSNRDDLSTRRVFSDKGSRGSPSTPELLSGTQYRYQVRAYNSNIISPPSNIGSITTATFAVHPCVKSRAAITFFDTKECTGASVSFPAIGVKNLTDSTYNFNDLTSSIYIPSGWSVRVYENTNKTGSSRCISQSMWDLSVDRYDNNGVFIDGPSPYGSGITSVEVFTSSGCTPPPPADCNVLQTRGTVGAVLFNDKNCIAPTSQSFPKVSYASALRTDMVGRVLSIYVRTGWSVRIFQGGSATGSSRCLDHSFWDLTTDAYNTGGTALIGTSTTSVEVYHNTNCTQLPMLFQEADYNNNGQNTASGATTIADSICDTANASLKFDNYTSLGLASSVHVRAAQTVTLYRGLNWTGSSIAYTGDAPGIGFLNDEVHSIKVSGGVVACQLPPITCAAPSPIANETGAILDEPGDIATKAMVTGTENDVWEWTDGLTPASGSKAHQSGNYAQLHQHFVTIPVANRGAPVQGHYGLYTYICLDSFYPTSEIMLQWRDENGSWEHRAYFGSNSINWGVNGQVSRLNKGAIPTAAVGRWVKLQVSAGEVGMAGRTIAGLSYVLYGGRAAWDKSGVAKNFETTDTLAGLKIPFPNTKLGHELHFNPESVTGTIYEGPDAHPMAYEPSLEAKGKLEGSEIGHSFAPSTPEQERWYFTEPWDGQDCKDGAVNPAWAHKKLVVTSVETGKSVVVSVEDCGPGYTAQANGIAAGAPPAVMRALGWTDPPGEYNRLTLAHDTPADSNANRITVAFLTDQSLPLGPIPYLPSPDSPAGLAVKCANQEVSSRTAAEANLVTITFPTWRVAKDNPTGIKSTVSQSLRVNKCGANELKKAFEEIYYNTEHYAFYEGDSIQSFNYRCKRRDNLPDDWCGGYVPRMSNHAWGTAIDLNDAYNPQYKDSPEPNEFWASHNYFAFTTNSVVVKIMAAHGWKWGGSWHRSRDYMHFSPLNE